MTDRLRSHPWLFAALLAGVLLVANIAVQPSFGHPANWPEELATLAPFAIVAMASTPSILSRGIDISIGPLTIFANAILIEWFLPHAGLRSAWVAIPLVIAICAAVGAINGLLVTVLRYQPVIATLCTFFVLAGVIAKVAPVPGTAPAASWLTALGDKVGFIPGGLILIGLALAIWGLLSRTAFHRNLYLTGGNDATAFSAGVNVTVTRVVAYALGGAFAGIAGIALTALVMSTQSAGYSQYTLVALAAVALGGTQLSGGRGGMTGPLLGACCIYLMQTLLSSAGVSSSWLEFVYGALLVAGVVVGGQLMAFRPAGAIR